MKNNCCKHRYDVTAIVVFVFPENLSIHYSRDASQIGNYNNNLTPGFRRNSQNLRPSKHTWIHLCPASSGTSYASIHEKQCQGLARKSMCPSDTPCRHHPHAQTNIAYKGIFQN